MLILKNIKYQIKNKLILNNLSLDLTNGITGIIGPNGAGKSTLLCIIAGILKQTEGKIIYNDLTINQRSAYWRSIMGYLPQSPEMYGNMSVRNYLDYMLRLPGSLNRLEIQKRIWDVLYQFQLTHVQNEIIANLSGGIKQRTALAQLFLYRPELILLDEPANNLDLESRLHLHNNFLSEYSDRIILYVGHDLNDMELICSKILIMSGGGKLFYGTPDELKEKAKGRVIKIYKDKPTANDKVMKKNKFIRAGVSGNGHWKKYDSGTMQAGSHDEVTLEDAYHISMNDHDI